MNIYWLLQNLSHTLAMRLTKLYSETTKLKFLQQNSAELTELFLNLDIHSNEKFDINLLQPFPVVHFIWSNYLMLFISKKYYEDPHSPKNVRGF